MRVISILILVSMTLHCLSRLEVVSYWYANRHDISYSLGLRAERVIAICKGNYFQNAHLKIEEGAEGRTSAELVQAQEILLGCPPDEVVTPIATQQPVKKANSPYSIGSYCRSCPDIFHPPLT